MADDTKEIIDHVKLQGMVMEHDRRLDELEGAVDKLGKSITTIEQNSNTIVTIMNTLIPLAKKVVALLALVGLSALFNLSPDNIERFIDLLQKLGA